MKGFTRDDQSFSLCGLNCGLCPMKLDGHCPGCGGGESNQSCKIARCSLEHGSADKYDIFITHRNWKKDFNKMTAEKSFYCLAVNFLDLEDLKTVTLGIKAESQLESLTLKEKSAYVVKQTQDLADQRGIVLKWNRKLPKAKE